MALYSLANRTTNVTTGNDSLEIIASSTGRPRLLEMGIWLNAATQTVLGLGRPQAKGGTPTTPINLQAEDPNDPASATTTALAWSVQPTIPLQFFRRMNIAAAIGAGCILTFPRGLGIAANVSLVLWNLTAVSVYDVHVVVDE